MKHIFLTGYSANDRHDAIITIERIVAKYGAIVDVKLFSDVSLSLTIEIAADKIDELYKALGNDIVLDSFENLYTDSKKELIVFLNISFLKGTGDLKIEVPSAPG